MQIFIHCHVTLHVSGVMHPSSGVLKTVSATSGVCHGNSTVTSFHRGLIPRWKEVTVPLPRHTPEVADTVFSTPDDGCVTPDTCRVTWQWINICILLHRVGPSLTLNHDARNHVLEKNWPMLYYMVTFIYCITRNQWLCEQLCELSWGWACVPETCRDPAIYK